MGIFNDFKKMYEEMDDEIPQFNPYNPTYIKDRIRVLKANPVRNRFKVGVAVRMTEIDERHQPINVTGKATPNLHFTYTFARYSVSVVYPKKSYDLWGVIR